MRVHGPGESCVLDLLVFSYQMEPFQAFFFNRLIADVWEILGKITALLEETKILRGQGKADCETGKYFHSYVMLYINSA